MVTTSSEHEGAVSADVVLSALGHEYRRSIFRLLSSTDGETMGITALIDQIAARTWSEERSDEEHRRRIRIAVHHIHLPKLESQGLIRYDSETKQVRGISSALIQELIAVIEQYGLEEKRKPTEVEP